jgi:hypothetical protein
LIASKRLNVPYHANAIRKKHDLEGVLSALVLELPHLDRPFRIDFDTPWVAAADFSHATMIYVSFGVRQPSERFCSDMMASIREVNRYGEVRFVTDVGELGSGKRGRGYFEGDGRHLTRSLG